MPAGEEGLSAEAGKGTGLSQGTTAGERSRQCPRVLWRVLLSFLSALVAFSPKVHIQTIGILVSEKAELQTALAHTQQAARQKAGRTWEPFRLVLMLWRARGLHLDLSCSRRVGGSCQPTTVLPTACGRAGADTVYCVNATETGRQGKTGRFSGHQQLPGGQ